MREMKERRGAGEQFPKWDSEGEQEGDEKEGAELGK
jgi:hypothetical protein